MHYFDSSHPHISAAMYAHRCCSELMSYSAHFKVMSIRILTVMKFQNSCQHGLHTSLPFCKAFLKSLIREKKWCFCLIISSGYSEIEPTREVGWVQLEWGFFTFTISLAFGNKYQDVFQFCIRDMYILNLLMPKAITIIPDLWLMMVRYARNI